MAITITVNSLAVDDVATLNFTVEISPATMAYIGVICTDWETGEDTQLYVEPTTTSVNTISIDSASVSKTLMHEYGYEIVVAPTDGSPFGYKELFIGNYAGQRTLTYDANGGTGAPQPQTSYWANDETLSTIKYSSLSDTVPTKEDTTFLGWATTSTTNTPQYQAGEKDVEITGNTLYAVWQQDTIPLRIKIDDTWKEAAGVYVKVNGEWKEATQVQIKANDEWKDAT